MQQITMNELISSIFRKNYSIQNYIRVISHEKERFQNKNTFFFFVDNIFPMGTDDLSRKQF